MERAGINVGGDLEDAAADRLSRPPDLQPVRGPLLPARLERRGQLPDEQCRGARRDGSGGAALAASAGRPLRVRDRESQRHPWVPGVDDARARPAGDGMLFPLGLCMGMAFPLGMRLASGRAPALTPWLWGVNG